MNSNENILSECFSPSARFKSWGKVEAALAAVQAELGMIPAEAAKAITAAVQNSTIDPQAVQAEAENVGHPLIPYLRLLENECGKHGTWLHYGATTDNITHTGLVLCVKDALRECTHQQTLLIRSICDLALKHAGTIMAGRTHSQQALPFTFGCKVAGWLDEFTRHIERQDQAGKRSLGVMMGGAVGSFASFGEKGPDVQTGVAEKLGLSAMPLPLRCITDGWAELAAVINLSGATLARMAADLKTLNRTEIAEVFQDDGSVGSSTMPQKRNPVLYHNVLKAWEEMNSTAERMQTIRVTADEGDSLCNNVLKEGISDIIRLYYSMLTNSQVIINTLKVNRDRMKENLTLGGGWIMAEALMFELSKEMGKTEAHDLLHDLAMASRTSGKTLKETALEDPEISKLGADRIEQILDPERYLGKCIDLTRQTVQRIRISANAENE